MLDFDVLLETVSVYTCQWVSVGRRVHGVTLGLTVDVVVRESFRNYARL